MGSVYFLQAGRWGSIKIGFANEPRLRIGQLQTASPLELLFLGAMPGGKGDETELHQRFAEDRIRGEWFALSYELMWFIYKKCQPPIGREVEWQLYATHEPKLEALRIRLEGIVDELGQGYFCANEVWYGYGPNPSLKREFEKLVGFSAKDEFLSSERAYQLSYEILYDELPACRDCGCLRWSA